MAGVRGTEQLGVAGSPQSVAGQSLVARLIGARASHNREMSKRPIDKLRIATPCSQSWNGMPGSDRTRHCATCDLDVYNVTAMTRSEAQDFIDQSEGRVCLRLYRRRDGTVLTRDCRAGSPSELVELARVGVRFGILGGLLASAAMSPKLIRLVVRPAFQGAMQVASAPSVQPSTEPVVPQPVQPSPNATMVPAIKDEQEGELVGVL